MKKRISKAINSLHDKKNLFKIDDSEAIKMSDIEDNSEQSCLPINK